MKRQAGIFDKIWDDIKNFFVFTVDDFKDLDKEKIEEKSEEIKQQEDVHPNFFEDREEIPVYEPIEETGEVKQYVYKLVIPDVLRGKLGDITVDHSYVVLRYLQSLGYQKMDFIVNPDPSHKKDICDNVARHNPWDVTGVLEASQDDASAKGYVVAPIFWMTHPGCKGYLHVYPPNGIDDIPDYAPGLHIWEDQSKIQEEKTQLMLQLPPVNVDRYTLAPMMFGEMSIPAEMSTSYILPEKMVETVKPIYEGIVPEIEEYASELKNDFIKIADSNWSNSVKPVKVKETIFIKQPGGCIQVVLSDFIGLQSEIYNKLSKVYLPDLERELIIPIDFLEEFQFSVGSNTNEISDFIMVDNDSIGMALQEVDGNILAYVPDFDGIVKIDEWLSLTLK